MTSAFYLGGSSITSGHHVDYSSLSTPPIIPQGSEQASRYLCTPPSTCFGQNLAHILVVFEGCKDETQAMNRNCQVQKKS